MKAAILGAGVIGAGWAARFLLHGWDVVVWDPDATVRERVERIVRAAETALSGLYDRGLPDPGTLTFEDELKAAAADALWVQESVPEDLATKRGLFARLEKLPLAETPVASSTSGFTPSQLADGSTLAQQILVCHPFNPVYLLPGVEVVSSGATDENIVAAAMSTLTGIGMQPVRVSKEIEAHVADRLLEAMWREALWLVHDGVATTGQIDEIIRTSFGLRWAQMGLFETYRLGGGDGGFRHFLQQFGPALAWPWSKLTDVPELTDELIDRIVEQSDAQAGDRTVAQLEARRDRNLVALLRALKSVDDGAGAGLNEFETNA